MSRSGVRSNAEAGARPLIAHVVHRFAVGGLENGVVNLINRLPAERWRHAVIALTDVDPSFAKRIECADVRCIALHKPPGQGIWQWPLLWRTFRELRPDIVHTRNLAALEAQAPAWAAGVGARLHSEHGRDVDDMHGTNRRHVWMRRAYRPFVQRYVALSRELAGYLEHRVGIPSQCVTQVYNGVDLKRFAPSRGGRASLPGSPFDDPSCWVVGTVGRMATVKGQVHLARSFVRALELAPWLKPRLRLAMIGEGPLRTESLGILEAAGLSPMSWLPGERGDVPDVMRSLSCFVLPSLAEGISNTILEAMASGLPVVATAVGGNPDLVAAGQTGLLVPAGDTDALTAALLQMAGDPAAAAAMGRAGRARVEREFSLQVMVAAYQRLYERLLDQAGAR